MSYTTKCCTTITALRVVPATLKILFIVVRVKPIKSKRIMLQEVVNFFCELRRMFAAQEFCDLLIRYGREHMQQSHRD